MGMSEKRVVMVVDMQNGVFETPRHQREKCVSLINQLTHAADTVVFIQHTEAGGLEEGSEGFALLSELRKAAEAPVLISHYNDVWRNFIAPANPPAVKRVETILENWKAN
jgi:nicotinamidase-related amidase